MIDAVQKNIVILDLDPAKGSEQEGVRPAVIISGNAFHASGIVIVCPITTKIKQYAGDLILKPNRVNGLSEVSEVLVGQVRVASIERIVKKLGRVSDGELAAIFDGFDVLCDR